MQAKNIESDAAMFEFVNLSDDFARLLEDKNSLDSEAHIAQEEISSLSSRLAIAERTVVDLHTESQTISDVNIKQLATVKNDLARVLEEKNAAEVYSFSCFYTFSVILFCWKRLKMRSKRPLIQSAR